MNQEHPIVYVVRHGQTTLNKQGVFRGPMDIDLDKTGWQQANTLKHHFSNTDFSHAFASSKQRTIDTADKILEGHSTKLIPHDGLQALNVGDLAGKEKNAETEAVVEYHFHHQDIPFPGGESFQEFKARVIPLLVNAIEIGSQEQDPVLLVVHSSIIHELGSMLGGTHDYCLVEPGGVVEIYIKGGELDAKPIYRPKEEKLDRTAAIT
jgi:broad specificity phosphatase PhoE